MVHHSTENNPPESPHGKTSFLAQIQNDRFNTGADIHIGLVLDVSDLEIRFRCYFHLNVE